MSKNYEHESNKSATKNTGKNEMNSQNSSKNCGTKNTNGSETRNSNSYTQNNYSDRD